MIVRPRDDGILLLRQADHAAHAGEMAALLDDPPAPASALVAAARLHDNGWREEDEAPLLDPATGRPRSYRGYPGDRYRDLWRRGIARAVAADPHAGLLVCLHGMQFFASREDSADAAFHAERAQEVDALLAQLGFEGSWRELPRPVRAQRDVVRWLDGLSLLFCEAWTKPYEADVDGRTLRARREGDAVFVDPFPFRRETDLDVPGTLLPRAAYDDERAMRRDFASGRAVALRMRLAPG